jgi:hypothetical protein
MFLDAIVESDPDYNAQMKEILQRQDLDKEKRSEVLQELYFRTRYTFFFFSSLLAPLAEREMLLFPTHALSSPRKDCAVLSEALLSIAVRSKHNIIFEATGSNASVNWAMYMLRRMAESGYETWVFFPYVKSEELCRRVDKRAETSGRWIPHQTVLDFAMQAQVWKMVNIFFFFFFFF